MSADTERAEIERELEELRWKQPFPTLKAVAAHNARLQELTRRLQELPKKPEPATGMAVGSVVIGADRLLGDLPPYMPETAPSRNHHSVSLDYPSEDDGR